MKQALGIIEVVGKSAAVTALDAACKAADVYLIGTDNIIGSGGSVGVNIQFAGEVAAVNAAIYAAEEEVNKVGQVIYKSVIPRPHDELDKLIKKFKDNLNKNKNDLIIENKKEDIPSKEVKKQNVDNEKNINTSKESK